MFLTGAYELPSCDTRLWLVGMIQSIEIKVCGMTREQDVDLALSLGVDFLGFIVYPQSPRGLTLAQAMRLAARVPEGRRVVVDVAPSVDDLKRYRDAGFDRFQMHVGPEVRKATVAAWSAAVGRERLWLAPRVSPEDVFPKWMLQYADTLLLDTYSKKQVGGTGQTGDFPRFASLQQQYADTQWVLAGGLTPANVIDAIQRSGARRVDVNSGVETAPGIKNAEKLRELFRVLRVDQSAGLAD
jgi:phosphoribosylanthranilate isomerase